MPWCRLRNTAACVLLPHLLNAPDSTVFKLWWSGCAQTECHMLADQHESCNEQGCPIDCEGEWGPWGECMAPCGTLGAQIRRFSVRQHEQFGGRRESCDAADGQAESRNCTGMQHCLHSSATVRQR